MCLIKGAFFGEKNFELYQNARYDNKKNYLINVATSEGVHKTLLNIKCVLIAPQLMSVTFLILRRIQRDALINVHRVLCKVIVIVVRF
jgi:hypothetical protein